MARTKLPIREINFYNPKLAKVGIEVKALDELRTSVTTEFLSTPQRLDFYQILCIQQGSSKFLVDFTEFNLHSGVVLLIKPGQIQQWYMLEDIQGLLVLISSEVLTFALASIERDVRFLESLEWPLVVKLDQTLFEVIIQDILRIDIDLFQFNSNQIEIAIIQHELMTLLLRLVNEWHKKPYRSHVTARETEIYHIFNKSINEFFSARMKVNDYANRLGFSESTISKACILTVGRTAKQVIDDRLVLEAKRLLVHSSKSIAQVGYQLGFSEPTNFVKFFKRKEGCTPLSFRKIYIN